MPDARRTARYLTVDRKPPKGLPLCSRTSNAIGVKPLSNVTRTLKNVDSPFASPVPSA